MFPGADSWVLRNPSTEPNISIRFVEITQKRPKCKIEVLGLLMFLSIKPVLLFGFLDDEGEHFSKPWWLLCLLLFCFCFFLRSKSQRKHLTRHPCFIEAKQIVVGNDFKRIKLLSWHAPFLYSSVGNSTVIQPKTFLWHFLNFPSLFNKLCWLWLAWEKCPLFLRAW